MSASIENLRKVLLCVAISSAIGFCAALPGHANAAVSVVKTCSGGSSIFQELWVAPPPTHSRWRVEAACPSRITFGSSSPNSATLGWSKWSFPSSSNPIGPISAIEFDMSGSDGSDAESFQKLRVCNDSTCGLAVAPGGSNQTVPTRHRLTVASGHIPVGATRIELYGGCSTGAECPIGRPLVIQDLTIEVTDLDKPTIATAVPLPLQTVPALSLTNWTNRVSRLRLRVADATSGVHHASARIGSKWWTLSDESCGHYSSSVSTQPCPKVRTFEHDVGSSGFHVNAGLEEGTNEIYATGRDAAGNASDPLAASFRVDTYAPDIAGLQVVSDRENGWQNSRFVDLEWIGGPERGETATDSGLDRLEVTASALDSPVNGSLFYTEPAPLADSYSGIELPGPGRWTLGIRVIDKAGNYSDASEVWVGYDGSVPDAPEIQPLETTGANELLAGKRIEWSTPQNAEEVISGICGYAMQVDRSPTTDPGEYPNVPTNATGANLPYVLTHGTSFIHLRAVSCAGVAGETIHKSISVDTLPPTISVTVPELSGWYSRSKPMTVTAVDESSVPAELEVSMSGGSSWTSAAGEVDVDLPDGSSNLAATATDASGNSATIVLAVRSDRTAPEVEIERPDPDQPTLLRALIGDAASGVRDASFFYRAEGGSWRQLGGVSRELATDRKIVEIVASLPDQELPPGRYEVQVSASDYASNARGSDLWANGVSMFLQLPVRTAPTLVAGFREWKSVKRCSTSRKRRTCRTIRRRSNSETSESMLVNHGKTDQVVGRLLDSAGSPMIGMRLDVLETAIGTATKKVDVASTDSSGAFKYTPKPGTSRTLKFHFSGSAAHLPADVSTRLLVRSKITLKVSRSRVPSGGTVRFTGRVIAAGGRHPRSGLPVKLQYKSGGAWRAFPADVVAAQSGTFALRWKFSRVQRPVRFKIRAVVPWVDGWQYETGYSNSIDVVVR